MQEETKEVSKEQAEKLPESLAQEETKDVPEQSTELQPPKLLMIPIGEPCPTVGKNGKCGRTDLCYHRKKARKEDEDAAKEEIQKGYQFAHDKANAAAVRYWGRDYVVLYWVVFCLCLRCRA